MGTGNYHPKTARFYDDLGILSADQVLGSDLMSLFNQLSGMATESNYQRVIVAPKYLRDELISRIRKEKENHLSGKPSYIRWKLNSLLDEELIDELYHAAKAGVQIDLITRGICAFRLSHVGGQKVRIRSILGRFLEHSRIYSFYNDGNPQYFIGSADIMDRNLNRRIETLVLVKNQDHMDLLNQIIDESFNDSFTHWEMNELDEWVHVKGNSDASDGNGASSDYQSHFIKLITEGNL
jgi:polyphosphate kinase